MKINPNKFSEIQLKYKITDRQLSKLIKVSPKQLIELKLKTSLKFNSVIYYTKRMKIPPEAWGLGIIETAMIKKGVDWKFLSVETGISVSALREIAGRINACDFRVKRSFLDKICIVLKLRRAHDFKYLYPEDAYAAKFGSETPEERKDRMKGAYITGKVGCWGSLSPKDRRVLIMKVEDGCSPAAKEPGFDIQDFIKRQADRMETGK